MAKLNEILSIESQRQKTADRVVIHLFQEGSFLRAYEWSAWLCCRYLNSFKVTRRAVRGIDDTMTLIGFPVTSLEKYSGTDCEVRAVEDKRIDIVLSESLVRDELKEEDFENWKQSVPLTESKQKEQQSLQPAVSVSLTGIMQRILSFPIERKSPLDCMTFMAEIKQQLAAII